MATTPARPQATSTPPEPADAITQAGRPAPTEVQPTPQAPERAHLAAPHATDLERAQPVPTSRLAIVEPPARTEQRETTAQATLRHLQVMGAHVGRQMLTTGVPYLARELIDHAVRQTVSDPKTIVTAQAALTVVAVGLQAMRHYAESRDPAEAARNANGLSQDAWAAKSPQERHRLINLHRAESAALTAVELTALALNWSQAAGKSVSVAAGALARGLKVPPYAMLRDVLQGSLSAVGTAAPTEGTLPLGPLVGSAAIYGVAQLGAGVAQDALLNALDLHTNNWKGTLASLAVKVPFVAAGEGFDDYVNQQAVAHRAGTRQVVKLGANSPAQSALRLMDQAPARMALVNMVLTGATLVGAAVAHESKGKQSAIGNAAASALAALMYPLLVRVFQADAGVRAAVKARQEDGAGG